MLVDNEMMRLQEVVKSILNSDWAGSAVIAQVRMTRQRIADVMGR